ncbi:hypothetical protein [Frankia sp. Cppng1_Ct_nod]|uniref:hypothetical protein n=1 Tax=Frankia sp. Cppng1_Ct_nod TaxID=2897162 RepID=UPI001041445F|nr:hypothetical protein [Frankia sp. Cppng1_Ct_nod]
MTIRAFAVVLLVGGGLALGTTSGFPATAAQQSELPLPRCSGPISFGAVDPQRVRVGASVVFSGCGFMPGTPIAIDVNGADARTATADGSGSFTIRLVLSRPGDQYLTGTGTPKDPFTSAQVVTGGPAAGRAVTGTGNQPADTQRKVVGMAWADASRADAISDAGAGNTGGSGGSGTGGQTTGLPLSHAETGAIGAAVAAMIGAGLLFLRVARRRPRGTGLPEDASTS